MFECYGDFFSALLVAEIKAAFCSEADGGNGRLGAQFFFVVLMPSHSLFAIMIEIG